MPAPEFEVTERTYSWGTLVCVYRKGQMVMWVDVYNDNTYRVTHRDNTHVPGYCQGNGNCTC